MICAGYQLAAAILGLVLNAKCLDAVKRVQKNPFRLDFCTAPPPTWRA